MFESWPCGTSGWPNLEAKSRAAGLSRSFNNRAELARKEMGPGRGVGHRLPHRRVVSFRAEGYRFQLSAAGSPVKLGQGFGVGLGASNGEVENTCPSWGNLI